MAPNRFNKFSSEKEGVISTHYEIDSPASLKIKTRAFKIPKNNRINNKYNKIQRINSSPVFRSEEQYHKMFRDLSSALKNVCDRPSDALGVKLTSSRILRSPNRSPKKYPNTPPASPMKYLFTPELSPVKEEEMPGFSGGKFTEQCNLKDCKCDDAAWSDDEDNGSPLQFSVSDLNFDMLNLGIEGKKYKSQIRQVAANMECLSFEQMDDWKPVEDLIIDLHPFETAEALLPHCSYSSSNMKFNSCSNIYKENRSDYRTM